MIGRGRKPVMRVVLAATSAFVVLWIAVSLVAAMASQVMASWGTAYGSYDVARLPAVDVALVLGTVPYDSPGRMNYPLSRRLEAAAELWRAGKAKYLIVSGNRTGESYDEPTVMRDVLVRQGVPAGVIYRDFAGLRTVTSIVRARDIYGQKRLMIVSQRDHVERALFLARHLGVEAWGYSPSGRAPFLLFSSIRSQLVVLYAYWDLVTGPRGVVGPRIAIGVDPPE